MDPVQVIANPNAAGGRGARAIPGLERRLRIEGIPFELQRTEAPGHAAELARPMRRSAGNILVLGGDGTIHEVVNGLLADEGAETGPPLPLLAILPMGTGNDFHRMVRAPRGVDAAVRILREGVPRSFDVGEVRWEGGRGYFVNLLGVGIDVAVLERRPAFGRLPGLFQYLAALASALAGFRPVPLHVSWEGCGAVEGGEVDAPTLLSVVTVGPSIGGGFIVSPGARPDDGLLDLFHVQTLGLGKVVRYLPAILRGSVVERREIRRVATPALRVGHSAGGRFSFELDGEVMVNQTESLEVRVLPGRLRVLEAPWGRAP